MTLVAFAPDRAEGAAQLLVETTAIDFGAVIVGETSGARQHAVRNIGDAPLTIVSLAQTGAIFNEFPFGGSCVDGTVLDAGQRCDVLHYFRPQATGTRGASFSVVTSAGIAPIGISGTGAPGTPLPYFATPDHIDFGAIVIGTAGRGRTLSIVANIANTGSYSMGPFVIAGPDAADFAVDTACAGAIVLGAGSGCRFTLHFRPTGVGARNATLSFPRGPDAVMAAIPLTGAGTTEPAAADVIEFYHALRDHYFVSAYPEDIDALDSGGHKGWVRTGHTFRAFLQLAAGTLPVCRFYIPPAAGDSHFYGRDPIECTLTAQRFPGFVLEAPDVMHLAKPAAGDCPADTQPLYRLFDQRVDANHRYTVDRATRDRMVANGWVAEGDGPDRVAMCSPQ